jgi:GNAT superfamily N-acetyltransferase
MYCRRGATELIEVKELAKTRREIRKFIRFAWQIYRNDPNFVPPMISDQLKSLMGIHNALFDNGEQAFLMAYENGKPKARTLVGTNDQINSIKGYRQGYLSLFECVNDQAVANALLDAAVGWLKARGMNKIIGPENYTYDDFGKGMLCQGFDGLPALFNPYNPEYYNELFARYGFAKQQDHFALFIRAEGFDPEKYKSICGYAQKRFRFRVDRIELDRHFEREVKDVTYVLSTAMPDLLDQLAPPTEEDVRAEAHMIQEMADQEMIFIARVGDRPVGFLMAMPDYNAILRRMNGRMLSPALISFLKERRRAKGKKVRGKLIEGLRVIVMFVIPEYQNKAVTGAMILELYDAAMRKGYKWADVSTIDERNFYSMNSAVKSGAKLYRTYRVYEKSF